MSGLYFTWPINLYVGMHDGSLPPFIAIFTNLSLLQSVIRTKPPIVNLGYIASDGMELHSVNVHRLKIFYVSNLARYLTLTCDEMMMQSDRKCSRQEPP